MRMLPSVERNKYVCYDQSLDFLHDIFYNKNFSSMNREDEGSAWCMLVA